MLSQLEFNQLSLSNQLLYVQEHGQKLFFKETHNHRISLLKINDFFVEIWFNLHVGRVDSLVSYKHPGLLDKFTDAIDLDHLLQ